MSTRYEKLLSKQDRWVSLNDLFDENNKINMHFEHFLKVFSLDNLIYVRLFQYGVLSGLVKNKVDENLVVFAWSGFIDKIPKYLSEDGIIVYSVSNRSSVCEDYLKTEKRKDFIIRINIIHKNSNVSFSSISQIDPRILAGFKIFCTCKSNGKYKRDVDLVEYWDKFGQDDLITIDGDIIPKVYFEAD